MSEPLETWIDAAIGETREALVRNSYSSVIGLPLYETANLLEGLR